MKSRTSVQEWMEVCVVVGRSVVRLRFSVGSSSSSGGHLAISYRGQGRSWGSRYRGNQRDPRRRGIHFLWWGWYGFNKGDMVSRDGPVCEDELNSQVDNRGGRELCFV